MEFKDRTESNSNEETIVVTEETTRLIEQAIRKHKKRPSLRGARMTHDAHEYLAAAMEFESMYPQSRTDKRISYTRLKRMADKLEGVGPYSKAGPVPKHKFNIGSWANNWTHALPTELLPVPGENYASVLDRVMAYFASTTGAGANVAGIDNLARNLWRETSEPRQVSVTVQTEETVRKAIRDLLTNTEVCGTTACACGYGATDPWFINRGLKFTRDGDIEDVEGVFHINEHRMNLFFMPDAYHDAGTPKQVAIRIRHFLGSEYFDEVRPTE